MNALETYRAAARTLASLRAHCARLLAEHEAAWLARRDAFAAEWRKRNKRRKTVPASFPELAPDFERAKAHAETCYMAVRSAIKRAEVDCAEAARPVAVSVSAEVWTRAEEIWISTYTSQGWGADRYARAAAESSADHYRALGVPVEVRRGGYSGKDYHVWVALDAEQLDIARAKPALTLREQVRLCWARGVNPRVYNPFLPHGYEERNGLDFFGGEIKKP